MPSAVVLMGRGPSCALQLSGLRESLLLQGPHTGIGVHLPYRGSIRDLTKSTGSEHGPEYTDGTRDHSHKHIEGEWGSNLRPRVCRQVLSH